MKNIFKEYFYYTNTERNGLVLLIGLSLLFISLPFFFDLFYSNGKTDFNTFDRELASFESSIQQKNPSTHSEPLLVSKTINTQDYKSINPNTADKEDLLQLDLSEKVAQTILNFRKKGGAFYKKEDLKKIYGLSQKDYQRIKDWINIPNQTKKENLNPTVDPKNYSTTIKSQKLAFFNPNLANQELFEQLGIPKKTIKIIFNYRNKGGSFYKKKDLLKIYGMDTTLFQQLESYILLDKTNKTLTNDTFKLKKAKSFPKTPAIKKPLAIIDINKAPIEDWKKIRGIGNYHSKRIIDFRQKLGGFSSIDQINDTYGIEDSLFQEFKSQLIFSPIYRLISINQASADVLRKHPYISKKHARIIVNFRNNHGPFSNINDLQKIKALTPETIKKIKPYLSFE